MCTWFKSKLAPESVPFWNFAPISADSKYPDTFENGSETDRMLTISATFISLDVAHGPNFHEFDWAQNWKGPGTKPDQNKAEIFAAIAFRSSGAAFSRSGKGNCASSSIGIR